MKRFLKDGLNQSAGMALVVIQAREDVSQPFYV